MPKRKGKKHKRRIKPKRGNKQKKSSCLERVDGTSLWNLIVELLAIICPNHDHAQGLATNILCNNICMSDGTIAHYCDPTVDPRKITYFTKVSMTMISLACKRHANQQILESEPIDVAYYLFTMCLHPQCSDYIDKCVEWSIDFFRSTQRTPDLNICNQNKMHADFFEQPYINYLQTQSTDLKAEIFLYLTLIGELFKHNVI
eukprot:98826_1